MRWNTGRRAARLGAGAGVIALVAAVGTGCGSSGSDGGSTSASSSGGASDQPYTLTIGDIVTLTGPLSEQGPPFSKAAKVAVAQANDALEQAGVKGVNVKIIDADDQTSVDGSVQAARKLIQENGAGCLLGPSSSDSTIATAQAAAVPAGVAEISPTASAPQITNLKDNGLVYRLQPSDVLQAQALAKVIAEKVGDGATIALGGRSDAFGKGVIPPLQAALEQLGVKTRSPVYYDPNAASFNSEATAIAGKPATGYAVLDFPGTYAKVAPALLRTGNFTGSKLYVAGPWPTTIPKEIPTEGLEGATGTEAATSPSGPAADAFAKLYQAAPGIKEPYPSYTNNFDGAMICVLASVAADSGDAKEIAKHIQQVSSAPGEKFTFQQLPEAIKALRAGKDIDYQGVGGTDDFDANGDLVTGLYDVYTYKNGKQTIVDHLSMSKGG